MTNTITSETITVINSVNQFEKDSLYYYNLFNMDISADLTSYRFLSRCPNFGNYSFKKPIRTEDEAEWLQFYIKRCIFN